MPTACTGQSTPVRWVFAIILAVAALLRLPALEEVPPPLNQDEISRGYDAWAILETGADRHGQRWPLFLESFGMGDFTAALTTYITVPFIAVLGPTALALRLPDALLGVLTVWILYLWLKRQAGVRTALIAAAVFALDPWHIALCRTAHESGFAPFFLALALLALHRAGLLPRDEPNAIGQSPEPHAGAWALLSGMMLGAHAWVYPATRLFTPLFAIAILVIYRRHYAGLLRVGAGRITLECLVVGLLIGGFPLISTAITHPE
ncbi:MAG TPA: glycosyltransferase family 39 protein, partial [Phycisphaerae bacterium]|nr:glycosyltransferase family 39 protein [Phycisphaerae bacterium]